MMTTTKFDIINLYNPDGNTKYEVFLKYFNQIGNKGVANTWRL